MRRLISRCGLVASAVALGSGPSAAAATFDLSQATALLTPAFRDGPQSTYFGWDLFDDGGLGDRLIRDTTPDLGTGSGAFVTTNNESHQSGSLNYYSGSGSVAEAVSFEIDGGAQGGFTTVIVQAKTLFGHFGAPIELSPIAGIDPVQVVQSVNAAGVGQLFAKYELPSISGTQNFTISTGPASFISFDQFVVDAVWSDSGFASIEAVAVPEPAAAVLIGAAAAMLLVKVRRRAPAIKRNSGARRSR